MVYLLFYLCKYCVFPEQPYHSYDEYAEKTIIIKLATVAHAFYFPYSNVSKLTLIKSKCNQYVHISK